MAGNIREFNAPSGLGLNPTETGIDSVTQAARRLGTFFNQTADIKGQEGSELSSSIRDAGQAADTIVTHKDISAGAPNGTQMAFNLDSAWNDIAKTPEAANDPAIRQKFLTEQVEPALEQFKSGFNTEQSQAWADHFADNLRTHLSTKTAADQATLAGIAVQQNVQKTINTLSSTVRSDPSSLDFALQTLDHTIGGIAGSSPTLDATTAAKVSASVQMDGKKAVVQSYLLGVAEKNPDAATKIIESGKYGEFLSGTEAKSIIGYARTNQRLADSEARNARVMGDYTAKQDFHDAANKLELSTAPASPGDSPTLPKDYWDNVRKIGQMPGANLEPGRLKSMVENGERITARLGKPEPLAPISHATTIGLINDMRSGKMTNNDAIYKAYGNNELNTADFNFLQKEFASAKTPEGDALSKDRDLFFKQYQGAIAGNFDPTQGSTKLYNAEIYARRVEANLRSKSLDPHLAYDPTSEYFVGKPALIQKYQGDMQADLKAVATRQAAPAGPADRNDAMPAIPPKDQRPAGSVYETPRGKMKWTGTGWVTP